MGSAVKALSISVSAIAFIVLTLFLKHVENIAVPVVLGFVAGLLFAPFLIELLKKKVPLSLSIIIIVVAFVTVGVLFTSVLASSLYSLSGEFGKYQEKILFIITSIAETVPVVRESVLLDIQKYISDYVINNIIEYSRTVLQTLTQFTSQYLIVTFTMIFVLLERSLFYVKMDVLYNYDQKKSSKFSNLIFNINLQVSRFLLLKTLISFSTAIIIYIGFSVIGVDFKFVWVVLTFLFNFIPTIGSIIITILAVVFSIIQFFPEWPPVFMVIVLTLSTQMIVGNVLDPKIMGDNLNLSPLVIWLALIYWGWVWGIVGALLAIPLTVIIRIVCEYVPNLHDVGVLMGNSSYLLKKSKHEQHLGNREHSMDIASFIKKNFINKQGKK